MIQFNLLPDVKLDYIKTRRTKRIVLLSALAVAGLALFVFIMLFFAVNVVQKQHIRNLNSDIDSKVKQLQEVPDLEKVLTIQNQLNSLTGLHDQKQAGTRLYNYLIQLTPNDATIGTIEMDFAANTMTIAGSANNLVVVNKFADTLKFTEYQTADNKIKPFSEVVLSSFGVGSGEGGKEEANYSISFKFDPLIFDITKAGNLIVPDIISTRSVTEKPSNLFKPLPDSVEENQ